MSLCVFACVYMCICGCVRVGVRVYAFCAVLYFSVLQCTLIVLHGTEVCCCVLQCVAVCCSVL